MSNHEGFRDPTADEAVRRALRKNRKKRPASDETVRKSDPQKKNGEGIKPLKAPNFTRKFPLPLVYISSPFGDGKVKKDREQVLLAKLYCRFAITRSCVPVAPRLLYPGFLRDEVKPEREIGNICGMCLLDKCSEVWVFGETLTQDMKWEIWRANMRGKPIRWFTEGLRKVEKDLPADCKTLTGPVARKKKEGEEPMTAGGRNLIGSEIKRNKRAPQCGVASIELAEARTSKEGEEPMTAGGRNLIGSEVKRNKRAPQCGVASIELAEARTSKEETYL